MVAIGCRNPARPAASRLSTEGSAHVEIITSEQGQESFVLSLDHPPPVWAMLMMMRRRRMNDEQ